MRLSFASFTLQPPPQQTSPSPWPPAFPLPLRPSENGRGRVLAISTVFTRYLIQGQLHLCLRKVHPNIRHNPSWQYGYCKQYPPNARILRQHMRLSFASFTLQPPPQQTSPSPWPSAFPLPLHPLEEEGGTIKRAIAIQTKISYISGKYSLLSKGLRGGKSRRLRVVSLLRRMLQVKTQKTHCKWASKKEFKDMACYIRLKNGDERVESGEFAETQMQRPPEQISSQNPYISVDLSLLSKGLRGGKERSDREESLLRRMLQSV